MKAEFNTFAQEAGSDTLYDSIMNLYTSVSTLQRDVFNMMCNQNWYVMKPDTLLMCQKLIQNLQIWKASSHSSLFLCYYIGYKIRKEDFYE